MKIFLWILKYVQPEYILENLKSFYRPVSRAWLRGKLHHNKTVSRQDRPLHGNIMLNMLFTLSILHSSPTSTIYLINCRTVSLPSLPSFPSPKKNVEIQPVSENI